MARSGSDALFIDWTYPVSERLSLGGATVVVGRAPDCAFQLTHSSVSREHLEIRRQGPIFTFKDLGSTNGTFLNGERLDHSALAAGDVLRVGDCVGVVWQGPSCTRNTRFGDLCDGLLAGAAFAHELYPLRQVSQAKLPILLIGETGTGKECAARAVHQWSGRSGPFCAINCGALPVNLAEAELFGYRRGAFTGSDRSAPGLFRAADKGTLLLDEVGDLPLPVQAMLLRVLEQREVLPLGETTPVPVDVRIVAAGQPSLRGAVQSGAFREDLFARLSGLCVELTPLRRRREDILPLFQHFFARASHGVLPTMKPRFVEALCLHGWPRNVRELRLLTEYTVAVHGQEPKLRASHLPESFPTGYVAEGDGSRVPRFETRHEQDLHRIVAALKESGGNLKAAAASLGISRARAYRVLGGRTVNDVMVDVQPLASGAKLGEAGDQPDDHAHNS